MAATNCLQLSIPQNLLLSVVRFGHCALSLSRSTYLGTTRWPRTSRFSSRVIRAGSDTLAHALLSYFMICFLLSKKYMATPVACGWAGAIFEITRPFGQEQWGHRIKIYKNHKKSKMWRTDRRTKRGVESHSTRLKILPFSFFLLYPCFTFMCEYDTIIIKHHSQIDLLINYMFPKPASK